MAKKLVYNYTFDASAQTIKITGLYTLRTLVLITNVTDQQIIYNFADSSAGGTVSYNSTNDETTITLEYDTTSMSDGDELQILADDGADTKIDAGESLVDPVHKFRVSNPQNLIDTDFEYGLQPTKWETIELVNNIPSLYSRDSGITLDGISNITTVSGTDIITVTFVAAHGLNIGDPIDIQGTSSITANGKYVVVSRENSTTFTYKARAIQSATQSINTAYTTVIPSAFFDGSEIIFDESGIVTDNAVPSTLTITTDFRHGLPVGSSVYLRNTVSEKQVVMSNTAPVTTNAPDGDKYVSLTTNSIYVPGHGFANGTEIIISPDTTTNSSATLPSTPSAVIQPENQSSFTCSQAYDGAVIAADSIITTVKNYSSSLHNRFVMTSASFTRYASGTTTFFDGVRQSVFYGDYNSSTSGQAVNIFNSSNTKLAEYRWNGASGGRTTVYGNSVYNLGQLFTRYSGSGPSNLSGHIWHKSTPWTFGVTDYIVMVRTFESGSDMIGNSAAARTYTTTYGSNFPNSRRVSGYSTRYRPVWRSRSNNLVNHGSGWIYNWNFTSMSTSRDFRRRTYTGAVELTMSIANTGWTDAIDWQTDGVSPVSFTASYTNFHGVGNHDQLVHVNFFFLYENNTSHSYIDSLSGLAISGQQMANTMMTQIAAKLVFATFANPTGENTVEAVVLSDSRISLRDSNGLVFDFTNATDSTSYPLVIKNLNAEAGGNDNYYDISSTTNTTIELDTEAQVKPRTINCDAADVLYNEDEKWYFISDTTADHTLSPGQKVTFNVASGGAPTGLSDGTEYYAIVNGPKYFSLATTRDNALTGTSVVAGAGSGSFEIEVFTVSGRVRGTGLIAVNGDTGVITGDGTKFSSTFKVGDQFTAVGVGTTVNPFVTGVVKSIVSDTTATIEGFVGLDTTSTGYFVDTQLNVRTDGTSLHRPFDGGVEMTAGSSPDTTIVRQTRKYFRYQSGKGIQCSMAINFNPYRLARSASGSGTAVTITTEYPHGLTTGDSIKVRGASDSAYNGTFTLTGATTFTFSYTAGSSVTSTNPAGFIEYVINGYNNAGIRAGLFDFQNGFFFEYDGSDLYAVRRSSVQQLPGTVQVSNKSNIVVGTNTKFTSHLTAGDNVVIRGQTHRVAAIIADDEIHIQPHYRGTEASGVVVTKTEDVKVAQSNWNIDKADGTGPSGYILDITAIQMVYMDYSWYGAGKIRFGFKDTYGHVKYMHEFIHNNRLNEAYMRSGNVPARYEVFNSGGTPTFVPSLFHWGTSVIMDGGFDDDYSYLFTASGNPLTFTNGGSKTVTTNAASYVEGRRDPFTRRTNWYLVLSFASVNRLSLIHI